MYLYCIPCTTHNAMQAGFFFFFGFPDILFFWNRQCRGAGATYASYLLSHHIRDVDATAKTILLLYLPHHHHPQSTITRIMILIIIFTVFSVKQEVGTKVIYKQRRSHRPANPSGRRGSSPKFKRNILYIKVEPCNFRATYLCIRRNVRAPKSF